MKNVYLDQMVVYIGGEPVQRPVDYYRTDKIGGGLGRQDTERAPAAAVPVPVLRSGERVVYDLSGRCLIIRE